MEDDITGQVHKRAAIILRGILDESNVVNNSNKPVNTF